MSAAKTGGRIRLAIQSSEQYARRVPGARWRKLLGGPRKKRETAYQGRPFCFTPNCVSQGRCKALGEVEASIFLSRLQPTGAWLLICDRIALSPAAVSLASV